MDTNDINNEEQDRNATEYTGSNQNREFHNASRQDNRSASEEDDQELTNVSRGQHESDDYSNTSTGSNYSASDRKEKFTDENYGMAGQYTRKDIINKFENNDESESESEQDKS